ncbi:Rid family hydrolase [Arenicella xantha]|uniref:Chorismate lyase/3-hydroxybenzoate synthase n=1 Tax=Arenicella xantha TaxID=644221 RepID=A0A395JPX4_9GAMM|nr:Rid family hydrolase [Arenicella xantha]RBP53701.1 chorismate lyase/3-hydroxybenzoate synthase [Arenicella xantha]
MLRNYITTSDPERLLSARDTLAVLRFTANPPQPESVIDTRVELLSEIDGLPNSAYEVWQIESGSVEHGNDLGCAWRRSADLQFCSVSMPLQQGDDFEATAYAVYDQLLSFINASPHPELVRFWNYIPNINVGAGDSENYKRFCAGRLRAFTKHQLDDLQFPAASAVGHYRDGITVYALTTATSAEHHANPRQVDAFKYPRQYGLSSPSFARATTLELGEQRLCFISGTASILGHSSVHQDDLRLQLYTTNDNILYLLKETSFKRSQVRTLRVYLRNKSDFEECNRIVKELFPDTEVLFTHADICRSDLLVEIECFCVAS